MRCLVTACCLTTLLWGCGKTGTSTTPNPNDALDATCWPLAEVVGPEDFAVDSEHNRLLVSSQDRRVPETAGAIFAVALDGRTSSRALPIISRGDCSFHPHGIALAEAPSHSERGRALLYVINHHEPEDATAARACFPASSDRVGRNLTSIEVFEVLDHKLRFRQRLAHPMLTNANDLVADCQGNLYVTAPPTGGLGALTELLGTPGPVSKKSKVVAYQCKTPLGNGRCQGEWSHVATVGRYINGIALMPGGSARGLVVSSSIDGHLIPLHHGKTGWQVEEPLSFFGLGHDNLMWLEGTPNTLIVASHPKLRRFAQHARSPQVTSPSVVWRVPLDRSVAPTKIYRDDGGTISAASTAACVKGTLILGQVFGGEVLACQSPDLCAAGGVIKKENP